MPGVVNNHRGAVVDPLQLNLLHRHDKCHLLKTQTPEHKVKLLNKKITQEETQGGVEMLRHRMPPQESPSRICNPSIRQRVHLRNLRRDDTRSRSGMNGTGNMEEAPAQDAEATVDPPAPQPLRHPLTQRRAKVARRGKVVNGNCLLL